MTDDLSRAAEAFNQVATSAQLSKEQLRALMEQVREAPIVLATQRRTEVVSPKTYRDLMGYTHESLEGELMARRRKPPMHRYRPAPIATSVCEVCGLPDSNAVHQVPSAAKSKPDIAGAPVGARVMVSPLPTAVPSAATRVPMIGTVVDVHRAFDGQVAGYDVRLDAEPSQVFTVRADDITPAVKVPKFASVEEADAWLEQHDPGRPTQLPAWAVTPPGYCKECGDPDDHHGEPHSHAVRGQSGVRGASPSLVQFDEVTDLGQVIQSALSASLSKAIDNTILNGVSGTLVAPGKTPGLLTAHASGLNAAPGDRLEVNGARYEVVRQVKPGEYEIRPAPITHLGPIF